MKIKLAGQILATTLFSLILVLLAARPLAAQKPIDNSEYIYCCRDARSGWSRGRYHRHNYNFGKIETLNGKIVSVDEQTSRSGFSRGIHLLVDTGKETVKVHLAPSWYLEEQDFDIAPEDKVAIVGSRIDFDGESVIIARQIKKGNETLVLREEDGLPMWRGRGWRQ